MWVGKYAFLLVTQFREISPQYTPLHNPEVVHSMSVTEDEGQN